MNQKICLVRHHNLYSTILNALSVCSIKASGWLVCSLVAFVLYATQTMAATYDLTSDFSSTDNPTGVWSSGFRDSLSDPFELFDTFVATEGGDIHRWVPDGSGNIPLFGKNVSLTNYFGVPGGSLFVHPGNGNEFVEIRFTAPTALQLNVDAQFFSGDAGNTDVLIVKKKEINTPLFYASTTDINPVYQGVLSLQSGDVLSFIVGADGDRSFDSTPLSIAIDATPIPEPAAMVLLCGFLAIGLQRWVVAI